MVRCPRCSSRQKISDLAVHGRLDWKVVLVQRASEGRQELVKPTEVEVSQASDEQWSPTVELGPIEPGTEAQVLLRHGFQNWQDCYPARQRKVMEELAAECRCFADTKMSRALSFAAAGTAEMAGYLSRWDRRYLKAYEAMAAHRFNFTTFACEPNVWGAGIGRGTFTARLRSLGRAASWISHNAPALCVEGPLNSKRQRGRIPKNVDVRVVQGSSERMLLPRSSADLILTDPPYHDDVQYRELSAPFRAWAGLVVEGRDAVAHFSSDPDYVQVLREVFRECNRVLKPGGRMLLTFANRSHRAWTGLFSALVDSSFAAVGFEIVHAENETDLAKRGLRSCTKDLVLELVHTENYYNFSNHRPTAEYDIDDETELMFRLGNQALRILRPNPPQRWQDSLRDEFDFPTVSKLSDRPSLSASSHRKSKVVLIASR